MAEPVPPDFAEGSAQGSVARLTDQDACAGCGLCADLCPRSAIRLAPLPQVDPGLCTGCGECIDACPGSALTLVAV